MNQEFLKSSKNYRNSLKGFQLMCYSWRGFGESLLQFILFIVLWFKWSVKKHCVAKVLLEVSQIFLHENNRNYNLYRFSCKFAFILFLSFLINLKQESSFQEVGSLVTRILLFFIHSESSSKSCRIK